jgi:U3 small nucleolar RNA-associated protein 12
MVKAYLHYELLATFGVIASTQSNIVLEAVIFWDLKKGTEVRTKRDQ